MKMIHMVDAEEAQAFVKEAADYFAKHPEKSSFTTKHIVPGCYFALRWGGGDDCVLLFKLDENFEPTVYQQAIRSAEHD